jgi:hypothetical protein
METVVFVIASLAERIARAGFGPHKLELTFYQQANQSPIARVIEGSDDLQLLCRLS